ncbi:predicted protein [Nematostella vectensis]|uniref:Uncharacterized protein n=1 Tax=Nematostella vectensis TaxID=45351 RepID=A7RS76_NEMVE|nr:predicted protein [Nematostella vectensis]|eukprot:XP_001637758.1 predicted protein [Nematostella vectensis]
MAARSKRFAALVRMRKMTRNSLNIKGRFVQSLPDKGAKINNLVDKLKGLLASKQEMEDLSCKFDAIRVSVSLGDHVKESEMDSDDDDDENLGCSEDSKMTTTVVKRDETSSMASSCSKVTQSEEKPAKPKSSWDYDSAVTHSCFYKCERAKSLPIEESVQLQQEQTKHHQELVAAHAAIRLQEQLKNAEKSSSSLPKFSSRESQYKYRDVNEDKVYLQNWEPFGDSHSESGSDRED